MDDVITLITSICAIVAPIATVVSAILQSRAANKHAAKQSIFQMILEDHVGVSEGHIPTNYQNILNEYDVYHKNGGNSYVTEKVEAYKKWYGQLDKKPKV